MKDIMRPCFQVWSTSIPLVEGVELLGVIVDNILRLESQTYENMSQSEPANRCFEKDEEVASLKALKEAL